VAKNIVIFSDGTGQGASMPKEGRSNVWKLWNATKDAAPKDQQITFYDEGLGAEHKKEWWRWGYDLLSKTTGLGISQNIKDCYVALIEFYEPGDRLFLFGFSRGAYTLRSLGGVLSLCGIPQHDRARNSVRAPANASKAEKEATKSVRTAVAEEAVSKVYQHYGKSEKTKQERIVLGEEFRREHKSYAIPASDPPFPYFIGVWDTVRALGIPGSSGVSFLFAHEFHDTTLNSYVPYACQALSIDENREIFKPEIWDERDETEEARARGRIKQVWFPGVHCDIGGGYKETGLSDLSMAWIIDEATKIPNGLIVDPELKLQPAFDGLQHNERTGVGLTWVEGTRESFFDGKGRLTLHETFVRQRFGLATARCLPKDGPYRPRPLRAHPDYKDLPGWE
jgi:uncharacterized protein (DUF2235 family)